MAFEHAQGITFTFAGQTYTATQIAVTKTRGKVDVSSTDLVSGDMRRFRVAGQPDMSAKVDWVGVRTPPTTVTANFSLLGANLGTLATSGVAVCTGLSVTGNAGDLIRGSATFKFSVD